MKKSDTGIFSNRSSETIFSNNMLINRKKAKRVKKEKVEKEPTGRAVRSDKGMKRRY